MIMNDNDILNYFANIKRINWKKLPTNIKEYLNLRYKDSLSLQESYYRIKYNIENRPKCPICGNDVKFIGKPTKTIFNYHCSTKCSSLDKNVQQKLKQTKLNRYGDENYNNHEKSKQTCLEKYGVTSIFNIPIVRQHDIEKIKSPEIQCKIKDTNLKKYGYSCSLSYFYVNNLIDIKLLKQHEYETKIKNHSYNKSLEEDKSYKLLKEKYSDIIRQYKSEFYPFACDFYIPSLDLYIECNYHWTHGGKLYEGTKEDNQLVQKWKNQNTEYYNNAIYTWTNLDVRKFNIAKKNKLNYLIFYNLNDLINWIK